MHIHMFTQTHTCICTHTCTLTQTPQCLCTGLSPQIAVPIGSYSSGSDPPRGSSRNYERRQWCGRPCELHYGRGPPPIPLSWLQKCSGVPCTLYIADASPPPPHPCLASTPLPLSWRVTLMMQPNELFEMETLIYLSRWVSALLCKKVAVCRAGPERCR